MNLQASGDNPSNLQISGNTALKKQIAEDADLHRQPADRDNLSADTAVSADTADPSTAPSDTQDEHFLTLLRQAQRQSLDPCDSAAKRACEQLLQENAGLVWSIARRYFGRGQDADDLYQLGCLGFLKAVRGFDPAYGTRFSTYAVPKIAGEIRRFLRDDGLVKVSRDLKERARRILAVRAALEAQSGQEPTLGELAAQTGLTPEEIAVCDTVLLPPESLERPIYDTGADDGAVVGSFLGEEGFEESWLEREAIRDAVGKLEERERAVVMLRFYRGFTQERAAKVVGVSQVQVSRLEKRAAAHLRALLG